jgi:hypothetical protein
LTKLGSLNNKTPLIGSLLVGYRFAIERHTWYSKGIDFWISGLLFFLFITSDICPVIFLIYNIRYLSCYFSYLLLSHSRCQGLFLGSCEM